jgi:hypothetical protein
MRERCQMYGAESLDAFHVHHGDGGLMTVAQMLQSCTPRPETLQSVSSLQVFRGCMERVLQRKFLLQRTLYFREVPPQLLESCRHGHKQTK